MSDQTAKADEGKTPLTLVPRRIIWDIGEIRKHGKGKYHDPEIWRTQLQAEHWMLQPLRYNGEWLMISGIDEWENDSNDNLDETVRYILAHPFWRLSVQLHKIAGLR